MKKSESQRESSLLAAAKMTHLIIVIISVMVVVMIPLYLPALFVSQLKKLEKLSLSRGHQVSLEVEQAAKVGKRLLDCELHCQAGQRQEIRSYETSQTPHSVSDKKPISTSELLTVSATPCSKQAAKK